MANNEKISNLIFNIFMWSYVTYFYYIYISMAYLYIYKINSFSNVLNGTNTEHIPFAFDNNYFTKIEKTNEILKSK